MLKRLTNSHSSNSNNCSDMFSLSSLERINILCPFHKLCFSAYVPIACNSITKCEFPDVSTAMFKKGFLSTVSCFVKLVTEKLCFVNITNIKNLDGLKACKDEEDLRYIWTFEAEQRKLYPVFTPAPQHTHFFIIL